MKSPYWIFRKPRWGYLRRGPYGGRAASLTEAPTDTPADTGGSSTALSVEELPPILIWNQVKTVEECRQTFQLLIREINVRLATIRDNL